MEIGLTEEDPIPFGMHKGTKLKDVPASYLLHFYKNSRRGDYQLVRRYIESKKEQLEAKTNEKTKNK